MYSIMSQKLFCRKSVPVNQLPFYDSQSKKEIQFEMAISNEKLRLNDIYLTGKVLIYKDSASAVIPLADDLRMNPNTGAHSFFSRFSTEFEKQGNIETLESYSRFVTMSNFASQDPVEKSAHLSTSSALLGHNEKSVKPYLYGLDTALGLEYQAVPFTFKPHICLNSATPGATLAPEQTGIIRLTTEVANMRDAFRSETIAIGDISDYQLRIYDVELHYTTVEDDGKRDKVLFKTVHSAQKTVRSGHQSESFFLPSGACYSIVGSLISKADYEDLSKDNFALQPVPGIPPGLTTISPHYGFDKVTVMINDSETNVTSYPVESRESILMNALVALKLTPENVSDPDAYAIKQGSLEYHKLFSPEAPDGYMIGTALGRFVDFSKNKLTISLSSAVTDADPYNLYLYGLYQREI